jgi:hypothetical protein
MTSKITSVNVALTPEQLQGIGTVCAQWSTAQHVLEVLLWATLGFNYETGRAVTSSMEDETRITIIRTLANERKMEWAATVAKLMEDYDDIRIERNKVVHNLWSGSASDLATGFKVSARGVVRRPYSHWSASDINELAKDIERWTITCINFCEDTFGWPK